MELLNKKVQGKWFGSATIKGIVIKHLRKKRRCIVKTSIGNLIELPERDVIRMINKRGNK